MRLPSLALVALLAGCTTAPPQAEPTPEASPPAPAETPKPEPARIGDVPAAADELTRLAALTGGKDCSIEARTGLLALHDRFRTDPAPLDPLALALKACDDWATLGRVFDGFAGTDADPGAFVRAKIHIKAKEFADAIALLEPLAEAKPEDGEVRWALGLALFETGRRDEAMVHIRAVSEGRAAAGRADALVLEGLAALDGDDPAAALATLERATKVEPANPSGWNALGRARARLGDEAGATTAFDQAAARHAELTRVEAETYRLSDRVAALERAYAERRFAEAQTLIDEALDTAPPKLEASLWEMRAAILTSTGDAAGAEAAQRRAVAVREAMKATP